MKKILMLIVVIIIVGVLAKPVQAAAPSSYDSTVNITNVTNTTGNITLTYYNGDGSVAATASDTINAYETKWYITLPGLSSAFNGSMVISSSVPLASMSMLIGKDSVDEPMGYASYIGSSTGNETVYLPLLMDTNYGFNTYFYVQNVTSSPVDVDIVYSDGTTAEINGLQPWASQKVDNQAETHSLTNFSAILTATGDIIASVVETGDGSYGQALYSYGGFVAGSQNPIFPLVNENNYGYWTSVTIQNMGSVSTDVTVTYTHTYAGTDCYETQTIPAGETRTFASYVFRWNPSLYPHPAPVTNCVMGELWVGGGIVTANSASQLLVGIDNQLNQDTGKDKGAALMSLNPTTATDTLVFPDIRQWHGTWAWWSSWTIINVSGVSLPAGDIDCHVTGSDDSGVVDRHITNPTALANGQGWLQQFFDGFNPISNGFAGGAVCVSSTGEIVGSVNILGDDAPGDLDTLAVYEGINP